MVGIIATVENTSLLEKADGLADMVIDSDVAEHYRQCKYQMEHDEQAQSLIRRFNKLKEKHEEVQRFGRYHPEFKTITAQVSELKRELDLNDAIATFKEAEEALEKLLTELSQILAYAVSPQIKVPTGNPFYDKMGGCGSGGACGCH